MKTNNLLLWAIILIASQLHGQSEYYADYSLKTSNIENKLAFLKAEKQQKFTTKKTLTDAKKAEIKEQKQFEIQQIIEERASSAVLKKERKKERLSTRTLNLGKRIDLKNQIRSNNTQKIVTFNQQKKIEYTKKDLQRVHNKKLVADNRLYAKKEQIKAKKELRLAKQLAIKQIITSNTLLKRALFKEKAFLSSLRISNIKIQKQLSISNRINRKNEIKLAKQSQKNKNYKYKELEKAKFHGSVTRIDDE